MTALETLMVSPAQARRKRLLWRAEHRGLKEMDLILGGFAAAHLPKLSDCELDEFETLLEVPDQQFLSWVTGTEKVPPSQQSPLLNLILVFRP